MKKFIVKNENGNAIVKILFGLIFLVFLAVYGLQIGLGFLEKKQIAKTVEQVFSEVDVTTTSTSLIKSTLVKKLSVETYNIPDEDIVVKKSDNNVLVSVTYIKTIPITDSVSIVMNLGVEKEN